MAENKTITPPAPFDVNEETLTKFIYNYLKAGGYLNGKETRELVEELFDEYEEAQKENDPTPQGLPVSGLPVDMVVLYRDNGSIPDGWEQVKHLGMSNGHIYLKQIDSEYVTEDVTDATPTE